jgi:AcrR family transcriptional regulator
MPDEGTPMDIPEIPRPRKPGDAASPPGRRRSGRRPGDSGSRRAILTAARAQFAGHGYEGATIRGIARAAGVDPALVHHFFVSKEGVFTAAVEDAYGLRALVPALLDPGTDGLGERLVRTFLVRWEASGPDNPLLAIIRSAPSYGRSAGMLRDLAGVAGLGVLTARVGAPQPELRAALVATELLGLVMLRYVVALPPLAALPLEDVVATVAPAVQRYLTGELAAGG